MKAMFGFRDGKAWRVKIGGEVLPQEFSSRTELEDWFRAEKAWGRYPDYYLLWGNGRDWK